MCGGGGTPYDSRVKNRVRKFTRRNTGAHEGVAESRTRRRRWRDGGVRGGQGGAHERRMGVRRGRLAPAYAPTLHGRGGGMEQQRDLGDAS